MPAPGRIGFRILPSPPRLDTSLVGAFRGLASSNVADAMGRLVSWTRAFTISCPFSYAAYLTEIMLLGVAALRAGTRLHHDGEAMRITDNVAANDFLRRDYRQGFGLS